MIDPLKAWSSPHEMQLEKDPSPIEIMINEMLGKENIQMKTDLTDNLILALTKGSIYADLYKSKLMKQLVETVSLYRVSRNRKGRDEIKEMARSLSSMVEGDSPSFLNRLFKGE